MQYEKNNICALSCWGTGQGCRGIGSLPNEQSVPSQLPFGIQASSTMVRESTFSKNPNHGPLSVLESIYCSGGEPDVNIGSCHWFNQLHIVYTDWQWFYWVLFWRCFQPYLEMLRIEPQTFCTQSLSYGFPNVGLKLPSFLAAGELESNNKSRATGSPEGVCIQTPPPPDAWEPHFG